MDSSATVDAITASYDHSVIPEDRLWEIMNMWYYTERQYFFVTIWKQDTTEGYAKSWRGSTAYIAVKTRYRDGNARLAARDKFAATIDSILSDVNKSSTTLGKEKKIHDTLVKRLEYNENNGQYQDQDAESSLIGTQTVCAGYSAAFSVLANAVGAPAICVNSRPYTDGSGEECRHMWNEVSLDNSWYNTDVLWDDKGTKAEYTYFNVSDLTLRLKNEAHYPRDMWDAWNRPVCDKDYGNTINQGNDDNVKSLYSRIMTDRETSKANAGIKVLYTFNAKSGKVYHLQTITDSEGHTVTVYDNHTANGDPYYNVVFYLNTDMSDDGHINIGVKTVYLDIMRKLIGDSDYVITVWFSTPEGYNCTLNIDKKDIDGGSVYSVDDDNVWNMTGITDCDVFDGTTYGLWPDQECWVLSDYYYTDQEIEDRVRINKKSVTLKKKKSVLIKGSEYSSIDNVHYKISNPSIANCSFVDDDNDYGVYIKGKKKGKTTVKITYTFFNGDKKSFKVKVRVK